ncbi:MAG: SDR family oxidoreductase [Methanobacteriota archaeon]
MPGPRRPLAGQVAVVAGATRGAGRGIARALDEAGATVYCTGRSTKGRTPKGRPETIEQTARLVDEAGGHGIPVRVDHLDKKQVRRLFGRVDREHGRLDILVNDIWGGDVLTEWGKPFWGLDPEDARKMLEAAIVSHLITSRFGVPMLVGRRRGLVVELTDGDTFAYRGNLYYDLVKTTIIRLAWSQSVELAKHRVASVAVTPGFMRSEAVLDHFGVREENWRDGVKKDPYFAESETPLFVGRAVAALAADREILKKTGRVFSSWALAKEYGCTDADGRRPDWGRMAEKIFADHRPLDEGFYRYWNA